MPDYGRVTVKVDNKGTFKSGKLLDFTVLPINIAKEGSDLRAIIYGIVEYDDGDFQARSLKDIKRESK